MIFRLSSPSSGLLITQTALFSIVSFQSTSLRLTPIHKDISASETPATAMTERHILLTFASVK
jgi:hypothetical protein